jgi:hypothetical protein
MQQQVVQEHRLVESLHFLYPMQRLVFVDLHQ